uniref:non-specific serine/threonine protein kinase n=1 Tax=Ananas comosus var. bracteatus TaxID=296719 RepID=A0A6V7PBH3_ANACO|nr:unnamed protein product [Ananas comosus var. bracteatus]
MKYYADADPSSFKADHEDNGHTMDTKPPPPLPGMVSGAMSSGNVSSAYSGPLVPPLPPPSPALALGFSNSTSFAYEELAAATNGSEQADLLGQGGFRYVHKGVLPNRKEIAARPVLSLALADRNYDELADPQLDGNYDLMEMARMVVCTAACVRHSAGRRPRMSQIVRALEGNISLEDLNEGVQPGQSTLFSSGSEYESQARTPQTCSGSERLWRPAPSTAGGTATLYRSTAATTDRPQAARGP